MWRLYLSSMWTLNRRTLPELEEYWSCTVLDLCVIHKGKYSVLIVLAPNDLLWLYSGVGRSYNVGSIEWLRCYPLSLPKGPYLMMGSDCNPFGNPTICSGQAALFSYHLRIGMILCDKLVFRWGQNDSWRCLFHRWKWRHKHNVAPSWTHTIPISSCPWG